MQITPEPAGDPREPHRVTETSKPGSVLEHGEAPLIVAPKKYPDELRERAVRLVFESGRPVPQVAADLGIHREPLRKWVRQAEADAGQRGDRLTAAERDRLAALEGETANSARRTAGPEKS